MKIFCVRKKLWWTYKRAWQCSSRKSCNLPSKPDTALLKNDEPFYLPDFSNDVHHEAELVIRINKVGKKIGEKFARNYFNEIGFGVLTLLHVMCKAILKAKGPLGTGQSV